jgi:hypothetical protein
MHREIRNDWSTIYRSPLLSITNKKGWPAFNTSIGRVKRIGVNEKLSKVRDVLTLGGH